MNRPILSILNIDRATASILFLDISIFKWDAWVYVNYHYLKRLSRLLKIKISKTITHVVPGIMFLYLIITRSIHCNIKTVYGTKLGVALVERKFVILVVYLYVYNTRMVSRILNLSHIVLIEIPDNNNLSIDRNRR